MNIFNIFVEKIETNVGTFSILKNIYENVYTY